MISYMKTGWLRLLLSALALASLLGARTAAAQDAEAPAEDAYEYDYAADTDPSAVNDFEDRLEPYGTWVYDDNYGYVWVPDTVVVGKNFAPYRTAGHWAVLDDGSWVWVSDYDWGYIPFHYGRWVWVSGRGWAWIPGRVYAPAWVVWRVGEPGYAYVGWAPAPPTYIWVNGVAVGFYYTVTVPWWYCPSAYLFSPYWHAHIVHDSHHVHHIHSHTHVHHHHGSRHGATASRPRTGATASAAPTTGGTTKAGKYTMTSIPRSPSFTQAQIPKNAIPKQRVKPNSRAIQMRKPTAQLRDSSLKAKRAMGNKRVGTAGRDFRSGAARSRSFDRTAPGRSSAGRSSAGRGSMSRDLRGSPSSRSFDNSRRFDNRGRSFDRGPSRIAPPSRGAPPSRMAPSREAPNYRSTPPQRVQPNRSQPSRSQPSRSQPSYRSRDSGPSGPSRSSSSFGRSSPGPSRMQTPSRSAPRMSPSRGSFRGGGGGRRR